MVAFVPMGDEMYRTLTVLTLTQAFAQSCAPIVILLGGIVGATLAPDQSLATLPVALMIVGTAATTIPASLLMHRYGRKAMFLVAAGYCGFAGWLGSYAIDQGSFALFCMATFLVGSHNAFMQQYRFAVAESLPDSKVGPALSVLMLAGVVAAYMGPEAAEKFHNAGSTEFAGSFLAISGFMAMAFILLCFYRNQAFHQDKEEMPSRPLTVIAAQPVFLLAIVAAATGWAVMSFVMTATPVSMHRVDSFSIEDTTWVIQSHVMAMYLPSLFSGFLLSKYGAENLVKAGLVLLVVCLLVGWVDRHLVHYWGSLVLLGVGWNFLFLGGTTLLTRSYQAGERFRVQALNDFLIFSLQALASLSSGWILLTFGWDVLLLLCLPFIAALGLIIAWQRLSPMPQTL